MAAVHIKLLSAVRTRLSSAVLRLCSSRVVSVMLDAQANGALNV